MILYKGMDANKLEAQYNLRNRRGDDFDQLMNRWLARSASHRKMAGARLDLCYGDGPREKLDYFYAGDKHGPLLIFIHGGYWQRGDKSIYSFVSEAFVEHGVSVAVMNYSLTPSVRIGQIPPQIRKAVAFCWFGSADLGFSRDKLFVSGHSAGGQLTALMMATQWSAIDSRLPDDLVRGAIAISGIFELEPLVHTSLNQGPQMDITEAIAQSPCFIPPLTNAPQLVVAGGGETSEFLRQSDDYAARYRTDRRAVERYNVPYADHFDELEVFAEDGSVFFEKSMRLIMS